MMPWCPDPRHYLLCDVYYAYHEAEVATWLIYGYSSKGYI